MKNLKQLISELPSKKVVMAFGRFQPPTTGHALLVNAVKKLAKAQKADHVIFASRTHDSSKNPLPVDRKVYYMQRMFPKTNFVAANENIRTFIEAAKHLSEKYKNLVMVAGSDRVPEYKALLDKYNGDVFNFDTIEVVSAGERDPDADNAAGMSGTKMREAAKAGNFALFKKGLPVTLTNLDARRLMNELRTNMGLDPVEEQIKFEINAIREQYYRGEIFKVGDFVTDGKSTLEIVDRGSNYVTVVNESGETSKKWLDSIKQVEVKEDVKPGPAPDQITYKGYTTKNFHRSADAAKAFQDTIQRSYDPVAVLNALKATDYYMGVNDKALTSGKAPSDEEMEQWKAAHEKAREALGRIGEFPHHQDYWHMHVHEIEGLLSKYAEEASREESIEESYQRIQEMKFTAADKIKIARLIANSLGVEDVEKSSNAESLMNTALRKIKNKPMSLAYMDIIKKMLSTAEEAGINYDKKLIPQKMEEAIGIADISTGMVKQGTAMAPDINDDQLRKRKIRYHLGEEDKEEEGEELSDEEIDKLINGLSDDDFLDAYDDEELAIVDIETGEHVDSMKEEVISEVLSRTERMRAKMRFARTAAKRERRLQIALHTRSSPSKINMRARRLAVKMMKQRIAKKPLDKLSIGEKERIERIIERRKQVIARIAMKLAPRVRKMENDRLSHKSYTK